MLSTSRSQSHQAPRRALPALACALALGALVACSSEGPTGPSPLNPVEVQEPVMQPLAKPDLVISNLNFSPGAPRVSDEITFWVYVRNEGPGTAPATTLVFRVGGETTPPETPVPALAPGAEFHHVRRIHLGVAQGYIVRATADARGQAAETDEDNNVVTRTLVVTEP